MVSKIIELKNHKGFMRYFKNTSWLLGEKILRMIVGLFVGIWVARYLGPEQFGLFSYAYSFVALFASIATLGIDGIVVRELVKNSNRIDLFMGTSFLLKIIGSFLVLLIISISINFTSNDSYTNVLIFIIASSVIFQSFNIVDLYFQSIVFSKYIVYANTITLLVSSVMKIVFILYELPLIYFVWIVLIDSIVLAVGYIYFYMYNNLYLKNWKYDKKVAYNLISESWPLILSALAISIYMKIDQVMIKEMLNIESVGQYAAAVKISEALYFLPIVVVSSIFPSIVNAKKQSKFFYNQRLQKLYDLMVWLAIAVALPMTFFADWLISFLFGLEYSETSDIFIIHIWTIIFISLLFSSGRWIINEGFMISALYRNLVGIISNIVLNYFLIKSYGLIGAAYATLVSYSIAGFFYDFFDKNLKENFYLKCNALLFVSLIKVGKKNE